jgi:hypothetical protein
VGPLAEAGELLLPTSAITHQQWVHRLGVIKIPVVLVEKPYFQLVVLEARVIAVGRDERAQVRQYFSYAFKANSLPEMVFLTT